MRSRRSKLLHPCGGLPLIEHAVRAACALEADTVHVVVGPDARELRDALAGYPVQFAVQPEPSGTAGAVVAGIDAIGDSGGRLLVIEGDRPGVTPTALQHLLEGAGPAAAAHIELNGGVYCFDLEAVRDALDGVEADATRGERHLTSVFALLAGQGAEVRAVPYDGAGELHDVNTRAELARAEALMRRRAAARLMDAGVTLRDPATAWVDVDVQVGADTVLHPRVTLEGRTVIGSDCDIRAGTRISNSRLGDRVEVLDGCIVEDSDVADRATLGPYARLRPGSDIGAGAKVGNFVETKATRLGAGSKASHLSYLGNARIGQHVNIGAGTITCNYDGVAKHETVIDDGAFIGSNSALVAPVRIGKNAYVGAGSTITEDVPDGALGLGRGRQVNKEDWAANNAKKKD
jgi:bifunctional UDP-N-acetylglucosamine pyrophosphorylase/glucosamine-1-phosphate N-acetyltransferase